jgi:hypothetical protein
MILDKGHIFRLMSLLSSLKLETQQTLPSFFGTMKVGAALSETLHHDSAPSSTKCFASFLNTSEFACETGHALLCTG